MINVSDYNAKPDNGTTDNTGPVQAAIRDCSVAGGGVVLIPSAGVQRRYGFSGSLMLPSDVELRGEMSGPASRLGGTVLEVHNSAASFLSDVGGGGHSNTVISDLAFWYPDQTTGATDPTPYPPTMQFGDLARIKGCLLYNSYTGIVLNSGRSEISHCNIGSFAAGVVVDTSYDTTRIESVHVWPFHTAQSVPWPCEANLWELQHGVGFHFMRADDAQLMNCYAFGKWAGYLFDDSPLNLPGTRASCGMASNVGSDACQHGFMFKSTQNNGWCLDNCYNSAGAPSQINGGKSVAAITFVPGGAEHPVAQVGNGWEGGPYSAGVVFDLTNGQKFFRAPDWLGFN